MKHLKTPKTESMSTSLVVIMARVVQGPISLPSSLAHFVFGWALDIAFRCIGQATRKKIKPAKAWTNNPAAWLQ